MTTKKYSVLYVDDEEINLRLFKSNFHRDFNVFIAISAKEGLGILDKEKIHIVVSDQRMPEITGIEFLKKVKSEKPEIKLIILTGYTDHEVLKEAINKNVLWWYINKPYKYEDLKSVMHKALEAHQLEHDKYILNKELDFRRELLDNMMNTALDGIITIDDNHNIVDINKAACNLFEYNFEDLIGKPVNMLIPEDKRIIHTEHINSFRKEESVTSKPQHNTPIFGLSSKGKLVPLESSFSKQKVNNGYYYHTFVRDISARLKAEKEQKESELRLKEAQRISHIGHYSFNFINKKLLWSDEIFRMFDLEPQEIEPSSEGFYEYVHPNERETVRKSFYGLLETKEPIDFSYRLKLKDGTIKYVNEKCVTEFDKNGNALKSLGTVQDITPMVLAEQNLVKSEERFKLAMKAANDGLWDFNVAENVAFYSPRYKEMLGYNDNEIENVVSAWHKLLHPDDAKKAIQEAENFFNSPVTETNYESEFRIKHKNGTYLNILSRAFGLRSESGKLIRIIGTHTDISNRIKNENAIKELNKNLERLVKERTEELTEEKNFSEIVINSLPGIFSLISKDGTHVKWNKNHEKVTGYSKEEYQKMSAYDFFSKQENVNIRNQLYELKDEGEFFLETILLTKSGKEIPYILSGTKITINNEEYLAGSGIDISERKEAESDLQKKKNELEIFNNAMIDRESRIIEMKEEVNKLSLQLGLESPYPEIWK